MAVEGVMSGVKSLAIDEIVPKKNEVAKEDDAQKISTENAQVSMPNMMDRNMMNAEDKEEQLDKKLKDAISIANNKMKQSQVQTRCEFTVHEKSNRVSIKLVDKDTEEVVKEIPPEKTIKMIEKLWEIAGLLIDEKL